MSKFIGMNMKQLAQVAAETETMSYSDWHDYVNAVLVICFKENKELADENARLLNTINELKK